MNMRWTPEELEAYQAKTNRQMLSMGMNLPKKGKTPKYRNTKVEIGDIKFDSQAEAKRWGELRWLEQAGEIYQLERQVRFNLIPNQTREDGTTERKADYVADFRYLRDGIPVIEDVKSKVTKTRDYILKRKLMLMIHKITIKEIQ